MVARIAQVPAADAHRRGGDVPQLDRIQLRQIGVAEHLVDDHAGRQRFAVAAPRRTAQHRAGLPTGRVAIVGRIDRRIDDRQRISAAVGGRIPGVAIVEPQDGRLQRIGQLHDQFLAAVAEVARILPRHVDARAVMRMELLQIPHDDHASARQEPHVREREIHRPRQPHARQIQRRIAADVHQFDELQRRIARRVVHDLGDSQAVDQLLPRGQQRAALRDGGGRRVRGQRRCRCCRQWFDALRRRSRCRPGGATWSAGRTGLRTPRCRHFGRRRSLK